MNEKPIEWCLLWMAPCLQSSEWASWFQTVFSAAAVFAAIAIVWWEQRSAGKKSLAAAQLAASGILALISQTIGGLQVIARGLQERASGQNTTTNSSEQLAKILLTLPLPSREDLVALNAAHSTCSINLLRASNAVHQITTALNTISSNSASGTNDLALQNLYSPVYELAADAVATFIEARQSLDKFCPK